ncbi:LacI family DNA-binding transcriptional regulator [Marisediminicola senii]|uniref:LacI family DNA-binding transcriptional regulator n=1 Tax=Marisediminicola senii TaxID=2711233 RepID=UPI0013EDE5AB|nr:substrate-binding domain-containing protein [Marisediminicola senii]
MAANISDVAKLAGVSHQTVSRVLNDGDKVRASTRGRVEAAIRELNYRPSAAARALASRRSRVLGLLMTGGPLYGPGSTMLAFNDAARLAGYQVSIATMSTIDRESMVGAIDSLLAQDVEALVLVVADEVVFEAIAGLRISVPLVAAESSHRAGFHSVAIAQYAGARAATRHLIELGHTRVLHVAGPRWSLDATERERGWRDELAAAGLPAHDPVAGDWSPASGYAIGRELVASGSVKAGGGPTAIFAANDQMGVGIIGALASAGIDVPGDVSIVGFDDIPEAAFLRPALTTVRQDFALLGSKLMAAVLAALRGESAPHETDAEATLIVRASTTQVGDKRPAVAPD